MKAIVVPVTPLQQNCTLAWCEETMKGCAVDPGGDVDRLMNVIEEQGITLEKIFITHGHLDHASGAADLAERTGVVIEGPHEGDLNLISSLEEQGAKWGLEGARNFLPTRWLHDGDEVTFGNETMSVHFCPGHTPGHIVFYSKSGNVAFVGDVLFQGSIGRTDFPGGDAGQLIRSITEQLWPLGNETAFVPGHGPMSTFGKERQTNPFVGDMVL
jgi:hydroxyacylglutathione hydrolase